MPWHSARKFRFTRRSQCSKKLAAAQRTINLSRILPSDDRRRRALLWIWKTVPFPKRLRRAYIELTHPRFLVGVVGYIEDASGRVLLFHHTYRRGHAWSMPGGYLEPDESPQEGIEREIREESGLRIRAGKVLAAGFHSPEQLDLLIQCEIVSGTPAASPEVNGWRYVTRAELGEILPNHRFLLAQAGII